MKEETCRKTIAAYYYKGRLYLVEYDWNEDYPVAAAEYMFEEGNYSCDCNKSLFIRKDAPNFPDLDCGDEIDMVFSKHM